MKTLVSETHELTSKNQKILERITLGDQQLKNAEIFHEQLERDKESIEAQINMRGLDEYRLNHELDSLPPSDQQLAILLETIGAENIPAETIPKLQPVLKNLIETRFQLRKDAADGNRKLALILGEIDLVENRTLLTAAAFRDFLGEN